MAIFTKSRSSIIYQQVKWHELLYEEYQLSRNLKRAQQIQMRNIYILLVHRDIIFIDMPLLVIYRSGKYDKTMQK